ncbi:cobalt-zinc-cadmium efflux system protein [Sulfitobacter brevis]|uniref:Cobalt-zinc-cadmium efflux system protein n=1 Tax=Sulfitobacter brevis TaxID=74348 RepID=A0A1I2B9T1_9RHOB|nr:cation diffusion facilitator family transporter [Sulfitobacter brevis]SFE52905.1 cobalt-zinc-cadmium efflux system protein [Sulfitobacter brevis]
MSDHNHDEPGHSHVPKNERKLAIAAILTGGFMFAEVIGGVVSGSLALIADAGHMLTDFASLLLAWFAIRLARKPADWKLTYGFDRFSVLAALVNGLSLFAIAIWITIEAIRRFQDPQEILGGVMLWVAVGGLVINLVSFWMLTRGESENLNVRAATLHVAGDLFGSVAALIASIVIIYTGWTPIDPLLSVLVVLIILKSAWAVVKESSHILLEGAPKGFDRRQVSEILLQDVEGVTAVHHIHAWSVTQERPMVTMEIEVDAEHNIKSVKQEVKDVLSSKFNIEHSTVEVV